MSNELTVETMRAEGLLPNQAQFILDLFADGSPQHHQLCAPVGTGKGHVTVFLIDRIAAAAPDNRVLVLGPAPVSERFLHRLRERSPNVQATFVNRRRYRELEASVAVSESPWKDARIVVMSDDFAKQKDIATSLATVKWDWAIVDESHRPVGVRRTMIEGLLSAGRIARLLLLTATPVAFEVSSPLAVVATTKWPDLPRDWHNKPLKVRRKVQVIEYQRSAEEVAVMNRLKDLLRILLDSPVGNLQKAQVYRAAQSSLSSLEQIISAARNRLAHAQPSYGLPSDLEMNESDDLVATHAAATNVWKDADAALSSMAGLLEAIDELVGDTKLDALAGLIEGLDRNGRRGPICIVSAFQTTVAYLRAALEDRQSHLYSMTGDDDPEERRCAIECCTRNQGILVSTAGVMQGFPPAEFRVIALYDLPANARALEQVVGVFDRYGREEPFVFYIFADTSDALESKGIVESRIEMLERLGPSGDMD